MRFKDYIKEEETNKCIHCHKNEPMAGRSVCSKCGKELDKLKKKKSKLS